MKRGSTAQKYIACTGILVLICLFWYYVEKSGSYVPIMDCWRNIREVGPSWADGTLTLSDLWGTQQAIHRNPLFYVLFLADMQFFHFSVKMQVLSGAVVLILCALFLVILFYKNMRAQQFHKGIPFFMLAITAACLNFNQWEIQTEPFSVSFFLRVFIYYLLFFFADHILRHPKPTQKGNIVRLVGFGILLVAAICLLSQAYFVGLVAALGCVFLIDLIVSKEKASAWNLILLILFASTGFFIYMYGLRMQSGLSVSDIVSVLLDGSLIKGALLMIGCVLTQSILARVSNDYLIIGMICGAIILLWTVIALVLYFKKKLYCISFFPLMCLFYAAFSVVTISVGRVAAFNFAYMASSRYVVETSIGLVGLIWMTALIVQDVPRKLEYPLFILSFVSVLLVCVCVYSELQMAEARKSYYDNLASIMYQLDSYSDDELAPFQANTPDQVRDGVEFLKANHLNIFYGNVVDTIAEHGKYDDGWLDPDVLLHYETGEHTALTISGYYPKEITGDQTVDILLDGTLATQYTLTDQSFEITVPLQANTSGILQIESNFSFTADPPDARTLSFVLVDLTYS